MPDTLTQPEPLTIRGKARKRDDSDLLLLLLLLLSDVSDAAAYWASIASGAYGTMLADSSPWLYTSGTMQWARGKTQTTPPQVKGAVVRAVTIAEDDARALAALLVSGKLALPEWQTQMVGLIKNTQVAVAAVARGGIGRLPASELARTADVIPTDAAAVQSTGDLVAFQGGRLQRFAELIEQGDESVDTADKIANRAAMYPRSAIGAFEQVRRREAILIGVREERNVLGPAEHCYSKFGEPVLGCKNCADLGWQPIGTFPAPGLRKCRGNCLCSIEFRLNTEGLGATP